MVQKLCARPKGTDKCSRYARKKITANAALEMKLRRTDAYLATSPSVRSRLKVTYRLRVSEPMRGSLVQRLSAAPIAAIKLRTKRDCASSCRSSLAQLLASRGHWSDRGPGTATYSACAGERKFTSMRAGIECCDRIGHPSLRRGFCEAHAGPLIAGAKARGIEVF